jgi:RNA polymerase sigma-70 factor (ECF subfamily)
LRKFVHDADELEDVLQDVFIKTYKNLYDFNVNKKFSSWIYRIAHNEAVNYIKKHRKEAFSLDAKELEIIDEKIDVKKEFDAQLLKNKIGKSLSLMKEKYREPLLLYYFEEKSYEEISDIMRIPRSTVGILIMRGKNILKEFLTR